MNRQPVNFSYARKWRFATYSSTITLFAAMTVGSPALAQDESAGVLTLEPIVVQARFADEAIGDVPFSVTSIDSEEIDKKRFSNLEELLWQTPGVNVNSWGDTMHTAVRIRGVGALFKTSIDDSSVVVHINGLPQSIASATLGMMDIEQAEILKGPQGTLFGRNSEGGVLNIRTRKPTREFEGYIQSEIGTEMQRMVTGAISGPLGDTLSGRLAFRHWGADSVLTNIQNGEPLTTPEDYSVRGTLLWQPDSETDITFVVDHEQLLNRSAGFVLRPYGSEPAVDETPGDFDDDKKVTRLTAEVKRDLGVAMFTSVTGYSKTDNENNWDGYDGLLYNKLVGYKPEGERTHNISERLFNQELRLSSRPEDSVFWVAGANYYHTDRSNLHHNVVDTFFAASPYNADIRRNFEINSYALFGEVTYPLTDALKITGGLRHTWDNKTYDAVWTANPSHPSFGTVNTDKQTVVDDYTTGRLALNYELFEGLNLYGIYAYGYKSAGFNDDGPNIASGLADEPYEAAEVDSYELGFKSKTPDGRFWLNGAAFFNETKDDHLTVFDTIAFTFKAENLDTESKGAELEFGWNVGGGLSFKGGVSYTEATITNVRAGSQSGAKVGNSVPDVPEWSATLSLSHEMYLPSFLGMSDPQLVSTVTNRFVGERAADVANTFNLASYNKLDARIGLKSGSTEFYLWGDNLLDKHYDLYGYYYQPFFNGGNDATVGRPARGRTFGIGLTHKF